VCTNSRHMRFVGHCGNRDAQRIALAAMDPGTKLGPYEILEPLGAGGMGEVYLAEDTRLHRKVAVKVLPDEFARDPERLARFEQEARAAAALNHPHIAAVFDVGEEGGTHYIVQEYLDGQSLRDLLRDSPPKLERALAIGAEAAEALAVAHAAGIVHRDIKPDNVFVTAGGHTKVLDFGLAKLVEPGAIASGADATMSPTAIGTMAGAVMGTVGYMAPEQVEAGEIDGRADIFALGCLLYELTSGRRPFEGENLHTTLGRIVSQDPAPLRELRPGLPERLEWVIHKCLAKAPARRYQHADDVAVDLRAIDPAGSTEDESRVAAPPARGLRVRGLPALLIVAVVAAAVGWGVRPSDSETRPERRLIVNTPAAANLTSAAISPDGRRVAFTGGSGLWVRDLDRLESRRLVDTREAAIPFWSPDGEWIAYTVRGQILKVPVGGGQPTTVGTVVDEVTPGVGGGYWAEDDRLLIGTAAGDVFAFPAGGGSGEVVVRETETEHFHDLTGLPDSGALLVTVDPEDGPERIDLWVDGTRRQLIEGPAASPVWWNRGFVLFQRGDAIWALPFDPEALAATGEPFVLVPQGYGASTASEGSFLYFHPGDREYQLAWVDHSGRQVATSPASPERLGFPAINKANVAAYLARDSAGTRVWWWDPGRGVPTAIEEETLGAGGPSWSPDGTRIYYATAKADTEDAEDFEIRSRDLRDGVSTIVQPNGFVPTVSPDGRHLVFVRSGGKLFMNEMLSMPLVPEPGEARLLVDPGGTFSHPRVSPDGRHIAYFHSPTGFTGVEVYIDQFPQSIGSVRVSNGGLWGVQNSLAWSPDGTRLFYTRATTGSMMEVEITEPETGVLSTTEPREIFTGTASGLDMWSGFDMSPDGERFLMVRSTVPVGGDAGGFVLVEGSEPR